MLTVHVSDVSLRGYDKGGVLADAFGRQPQVV